MRVESMQLAPITTTLPSTSRSAPVLRSKYCTPLARPRSSTSTRAATAFERISSLPVSSAKGSRWSAELKKDAVSQPRPQVAAEVAGGESAVGPGHHRAATGTTGMPRPIAALWRIRSPQRGAGGGMWYLLPGRVSESSSPPQTPMSCSTWS